MMGKYILTQGTDIADFNENFEVLNCKHDKSNSMQVAIGLHPIYFEEITLQRGITEDIFENHRKR